jgi:hypothetical protein
MFPVLIVATLAILAPGRVWGQAIALGPEFQVNTYTTGNQNPGNVAMDADGNFVIVTSGSGGVRAHLFDAAGERIGSDVEVAPGSSARVAMKPNGDFVVVYRDGEIYGRCFDSLGVPQGATFQVNTYTTDLQRGQSVAMDPVGNFVVVWQSDFQDGQDFGVFGQRFDSAGAPAEGEFAVNAYTSQSQYNPEVAMDDDGDFVVVWQDGGRDGSDAGVFARRFDSSANPLDEGFQVNTYTTNPQGDPAVAFVGVDGSFIVAWTSMHQEGPDRNTLRIYAQRYDGTGTPAGEETAVSKPGPRARGASVAADAEGNTIIAWLGTDFFVSGRRFDAAGVPQGGQFDVHSPEEGGIAGTEQTASRVAMHPDGGGGFVAVWQGAVASDGDLRGVFARAYSPRQSLFGKKLLIKNKVPDDDRKNKGTWSVKDDQLIAGTRGTEEDPRCNGDATGTVKASIRFFSDASGQDTGDIPLPCQNWTALGPDQLPRGYKYRDPELDDSPCRLVRISTERSILAKCTGKGETTDFPYDLAEGVDEGLVQTVLTVGHHTYCTRFDDFKGKDGSDGKKFQGKNAPVLGPCPAAASPSGAFIDAVTSVVD